MKKIVELLANIDGEEVENAGVDIMSFVEDPAIGIDFLAFSQEEFVEPKSGESEDEFIGRCIPVLLDEGYPQEQAIAICYSYWEGKMESENCEECGEDFLYENPCQEGWIAYGTKIKNGRRVPNCIPIENSVNFDAIEIDGKIAFDNILAAIMFAQEIGCEGYHKHEYEGKTWYMPCKSHDESFESYSNYPKKVKENAARGIGLNEEVENKCATQVGKIRAQQLAQGKPISFETVKRMYSYLSRAAAYYNPEDTQACGTISYLLWGGEEALKWSERMIQQKQQEEIVKIASEEGFGELIPNDAIYIDITKGKFSTIGDFLKGIISLDILGKRVRKNEKPEQKFRYAGPPAERNFCKAMKRLNKIYTLPEIDEMETRGINGTFAPSGESSYSIFEFKGGVSCKHFWEELEVFRSDEGQLVMISRGPAAGNAGKSNNQTSPSPDGAVNNNASLKYPGSFQFKVEDEEKRIVVGPAMVPNKLILRKDEMGNLYHVYFSKKTIRELAEKFFKYQNQNNTDVNHDEEVTQGNTLIESWIVENPQMDKATHLGFNVPEGTWMTSYKVNDENTWKMIKEGRIKGFSVAGNFISKNTKLA